MVKGRNTSVMCIRIPDSVYATIKERADQRGVSMSDWVRRLVDREMLPWWRRVVIAFVGRGT